jgi:WD40 repeat protein
VETGEQLRVFEGHSDGVRGVAFAADGETVFSASMDNSVIQWDLDSGDIIHRYEAGEDGRILALEISHDGSKLLIGGIDDTDGRGIVRLVDPESWETLQDYSGYPSGIVQDVAFAKQGGMVLAAGGATWASTMEAVLMAWDTNTGEVMKQLDLIDGIGGVTALDLSPDGETVLAAITTWRQPGESGYLVMWDIQTWEELDRFEGDYAFAFATAFGADGQTVLSSSWNDVNILWDRATGAELRRLVGHGSGQVKAMVFGPDGQTVFTASTDFTLRRWSLSSGLELARLTVPDAEYAQESNQALALSPDGKTAITSGTTAEGYPLILWDLSSGEEIGRFTSQRDGHPCQPYTASFTPDGRHVLSASGGRPTGEGYPSGCEPFVAIKWDVSSGREVGRLGEGLPIYVIDDNCHPPLVLSPDGQSVLVNIDGTSIGVVDVDTGELTRRLGADGDGHSRCILDFTFSPDGKVLMTSSGSHIIAWNWESGQQIANMTDIGGYVRGSAFSPDGRYAVSGGDFGPALLWDTETWEVETTFGSENGATAIAFSPDGRSVLFSPWFGTVQLWDVATSAPLLTYTGPTEFIPLVAFGPDGDRAYSVSNDALWIWDIIFRTSEELIDWTLANRYVPELTDEQRVFYGLQADEGTGDPP